MSYVVAIPTYNRSDIIAKKTLQTLKDGHVNKNKIYIFVANEDERKLYEEAVPKSLYHKIVVGVKGITMQRKFIVKYFPQNQYVISMDDDVEELQKLTSSSKLAKITNLDAFFKDAYKLMKKEKLYIWGIYPVQNAFFMKPKITTDLRFIIGVTYGFINRHDKSLEPSSKIETKEDYELSILYYKKDGGVIRYNGITPKTKFNAEGGVGKDRFERNKVSAAYLKATYPDIISTFHRENGMAEVKFKKMPRFDPANPNATLTPTPATKSTKKTKSKAHKSKNKTRKNQK